MRLKTTEPRAISTQAASEGRWEPAKNMGLTVKCNVYLVVIFHKVGNKSFFFAAWINLQIYTLIWNLYHL